MQVIKEMVVSPSTKVIKFQLITTVRLMLHCDLCCFTFYKGNKISANHNVVYFVCRNHVVVSPSTKVIKFQLITTLILLISSLPGCFTFYKGNKISANHNGSTSQRCRRFVVSPSTKVIKFQLITTNDRNSDIPEQLFHLLQR